MLHEVAQKHERYLDLLSARQKLVASNLANADTPGYKTRDVDFQGEFQRALDTIKEEGVSSANLVGYKSMPESNGGQPSTVAPAPWMAMGEGLGGALGGEPGRELEIVEPDTLVVHNDGNNVNLDREARMLAENSLRFQMVSMMARGHFRGVKRALEADRGA